MAQALVVALASVYVWFTLWTNGDPGWPTLVVAAPVWGWLAFRTWTLSATLAQDALIVRNVLSTEEIAVANIARVGFSRYQRVLKVMERASGERDLVTAIQIGAMAWGSGLRCAADEAADLIAAAAGLPPLPPRKAQVSRARALFSIPAGLALLVAGFLYSPPAGRPAAQFAATALKAGGFLLLLPAVPATLDRLFRGNRT
jgi:hypothetical protein